MPGPWGLGVGVFFFYQKYTWKYNVCSIKLEMKMVQGSTSVKKIQPIFFNCYSSNEKSTADDLRANPTTFFHFHEKNIIFFETFLEPFLWTILHLDCLWSFAALIAILKSIPVLYPGCSNQILLLGQHLINVTM